MGKKIITIDFVKDKVSIRGGKGKATKGKISDFFGNLTSDQIVDAMRPEKDKEAKNDDKR